MRRNERRVVGWVVVLVVMLAVAAAAAGEEAEESGGAVPLADVEWVGLVWSAGEAGVVPAVLLDAEVEIAVGGMVARSLVRQTFVNQGEEWAEGVYVFPLPENAAVDRLRMVVGERVIEGQVREKEAARREFEAARREGRRASLLEQHRPNVFTTRVTNVAPGEAVEVTIELQQAVDYDAGRMRLRFPTVVAPRYFPGTPGLGPHDGDEAAPEVPAGVRAAGGAVGLRGTGDAAQAPRRSPLQAVDRQAGPGTAPPSGAGRPAVALSAGCCPAEEDAPPLRFVADAVAAVAGHAGRALEAVAGELRPEPPPPNRLSLAVHLDPGFPLASLGSPSHAVEVTAAGARGWRVALAGQGEAADRDFELVWEPAPGRAPRAALFTEEHEGDTYALLVVLPPEPESPGWAPLAREVVFVLDTSGSMAGVAHEQARAALSAALGRLEPWDLFNVIEFDDRARPLFPASVPADPAAVERARAWVAGLEADGGTEMRQALELALPGAQAGDRRPDADRVRQIVFLTDGAVGNEDELLATIAARLGDARLFTVGIGSAPNGYFMRRAAEVGRGGFTWIGDTAEVGRAVDDLARKLEGPVLTDLEVAWDDPTAEVWPQRLPDLYAGEPLVVAARLIRPGDEVRVSGRRGGVWWQETVRFGEAGGEAAEDGSHGAAGGPAAIGMPGRGPVAGAADAAPIAVPAVARGVRQLWARRKIDHWLGRLVESVPEDEVRREVVAVALAHHLVSRWTSLVAVDITPVRPAGEALAATAVPLALPEGQLPMGGTSARWDFVVGIVLMLLALPLLVSGRRKDRQGELVGAGADGGEASSAMGVGLGRLAFSAGGGGEAAEPAVEAGRQEIAVAARAVGDGDARAVAGEAGRQAVGAG